MNTKYDHLEYPEKENDNLQAPFLAVIRNILQCPTCFWQQRMRLPTYKVKKNALYGLLDPLTISLAEENKFAREKPPRQK